MTSEPKYHDRVYIGPGTEHFMVELYAVEVRALWLIAEYVAEHEDQFREALGLPDGAMERIHEAQMLVAELADIVSTLASIEEAARKMKGGAARRRPGLN